MAISASSRRTISTPVMTGPLIIKAIEAYPGVVADPPSGTLEIGYAPVTVTEAGVPLATARPYSVLTELLDPFAVIPASAGAGYPNSTLPPSRINFERLLELILTAPEAYITISYVNDSIGAFALTGSIRIIEAISKDAAENFL